MAIIACDSESIDPGLQNNNVPVHPIQGVWHLYKNRVHIEEFYYHRGDQVMTITADSVFTTCVPNFNSITPGNQPGWIYDWHCNENLDYKIFTDSTNNNAEYLLIDYYPWTQQQMLEPIASRITISGDTLTMDLDNHYPGSAVYFFDPGMIQWVR
ncbi:MAG: hypothetical protein ACSHWW_07570 [Nonlabens sp.]|uniref:hypothetical protein n=1 Tax=Nonlabens sp. TaxID=1888209 RepID=UPI003EF4F3C1